MLALPVEVMVLVKTNGAPDAEPVLLYLLTAERKVSVSTTAVSLGPIVLMQVCWGTLVQLNLMKIVQDSRS